jgi:V8-like Glu-specific endopeptidase
MRYGNTDELLLLTNAHVVSDDAKVHKQLSDKPPLWPQEARVHFELDDVQLRVAEVLKSSGPDDLDFSLMRLTPRLTKRAACPLDATPKKIDEVYRRVYVIGHPGGRGLTFSLSDNMVLGFRAPKLHYRAPTEYGSSGSPVFTADWDVLALHHAGGTEMPKLVGRGKYPANEGIWIAAIQQHLAKGKARRKPGARRK